MEKYKLVVEVNNKKREFTLDDLKKLFKKEEIISCIQCAGNRRAELNTVGKTLGLEWD